MFQQLITDMPGGKPQSPTFSSPSYGIKWHTQQNKRLLTPLKDPAFLQIVTTSQAVPGVGPGSFSSDIQVISVTSTPSYFLSRSQQQPKLPKKHNH